LGKDWSQSILRNKRQEAKLFGNRISEEKGMFAFGTLKVVYSKSIAE